MTGVVEGPRGWGLPLYERILDRTGIGSGTSVLDLGCGRGLFCRLAVDRGATVAGIDVASEMVEEAKHLTPEGNFRTGDVQALPYPDDTFDVVTSFQTMNHVPNPLAALREAARVARPGRAVAVTVWGREEDCEMRAFGLALSPLIRSQPQDPAPRIRPPALGRAGRLEQLAVKAGLDPRETGEVICEFVYADEDTMMRGVLRSHLGRLAAGRSGEEAVRRAIIDGLSPYLSPDGTYRLCNQFRYLIATA
jgi:SAM-dependent methyltransferase